MSLQPLSVGQIRPTGWVAEAMRQRWAAGLPEGGAPWARHALMVGEGKGKMLVRAWTNRNPGWSVPPTPLPGEDPGWGDSLEAQAFSGGAGLDEYVAQQVFLDPRGLRIALYGPAVAKTEVASVAVEVELETTYPRDHSIDLRLYPETPVAFSLFLRIPGWASGALVTGDGASGGELTDQEGWLELRRTWIRGDSLTVRFETPGATP